MKEYCKRYKKAKKFLARSIRGVNKLMANEAFNIWKGTNNTATQMVYMEQIEELSRREEEHVEQIKTLNRKIEMDESSQSHLVSKMQQQSHRIMGNFIARFIHVSLARGFFTWVDKCKDTNNKRRFLRSTMIYWMKNQQAKGFRKWADFSLKS